MTKPVMSRERVSPALAAEWLETNTTNRPLSTKRVLALANAIKRGEWKENGETIKFNGDGTLIDGQHRLAAITRGGKTITTWVARGLPSETQETVDTGSSRTFGAMLAIRGYKNYNALASASRMVCTYQTSGEMVASQAFLPATPQQLFSILEEAESLPDCVAWGATIARKDPALRLSASAIGAMTYLFSQVSSDEDARSFFDELIAPKSQSDATAVLRKRLLQHGFHTPIPMRLRLALVVKGWNAWIAGETPTRLTWRAGGAKKEDFPTISSMVAE